jgi:hypothetical protein
MEAPLAPVAPTSDIQLSVPLINRTKYFSEFVSKDTLFKSSSDGGYYYASSQSVKPVGIDTIKFTPNSGFEQVAVGVFQIDPPAPFGDTLNYKEITGSDAPAFPITSPAQTYPIPPTTTSPLPTFVNATFETGTISLSIRNKFPVAIDFPDPIIVNNSKFSPPVDTNEVARFPLAGKSLQPGEVYTVTSSLANVTVQSSWHVESFRMHGQASIGPVSYTPQSGIEYIVTLSNLTARSAMATIPPQALLRTRDTVIVVDDSVTLQSATFRGGSFDIVFQNAIDVNAKVSLKINELIDKTTGAPLTVSSSFNGRGTTRIPINAANLRVQSSSPGMGTRLTLSSTVESIESPVARQVNSTDFLRIDFQPRSPFIIQSITGRIKPTTLKFSAGAGGINLGDFADKFKGNVTFDSVRLALKLSMSGGFPTDYNLYLVAMNRRVSPAHIDSLVLPPPVGSTLRRIFPAQGALTQIVLDNSTGLNGFLSRFFPNLPDSFIVRGSAVMNPLDVFPTALGIQTVYDTSKVYASVDISFPLKIGIAGGEVSETSDLTDNKNSGKDEVKSVKTGTMFFEVTNGLPLQLVFQSALLGKSIAGKRDTLLRIPTDGPRTIAAAAVDQGGSVTGTKKSSFFIQLKGSDIDAYNNADAIWFKLQVETTGGGTVPVKFRSSDSVSVRASATMVYTINKK